MNGIIISFIIIIISLIILIFINRRKNKYKKLSEYSFTNPPNKILKEEDHVTCFLCLKNGNFLSGQMNGMISLYRHKDFKFLALIIEFCEPITSLSELNDGTILVSSAEGILKKIKLLNDNNDNPRKNKYLVEFVFYTNKEFIFKSIQLQNSEDILSSNIAKELILWKKTENEIELYKFDKILLKNEYVRDIFQINENIFITAGESLQCWDIQNYKSIKNLNYECKGNNSIYKLNEELTGIFLKNNGDILLFNNNDLIGITIINLSKFSLTSLKLLRNTTILVGIFNEQNKKSFINQYIIKANNQKREKNEKEKFEMIKIKEEEVNFTEDDIYFNEFDWSRINTIDEIDNFVVLGIGGQEKMRNFGKLMIFKKNI